MLARILLSTVLLVTSFAVSAEATKLPFPVKEQTGMYLVEGDYAHNFQNVIPRTGLSLEIVEPPNALVPGGAPTERTFIFGAVYKSDGKYFLFSGFHIAGTVTTVEIYETVDGEGVPLGAGFLIFDAERTGDARTIDFSFSFDREVSFGEDSGVLALNGKFIRSVDVQINRCVLSLDFSPIDPRADKPCNQTIE